MICVRTSITLLIATAFFFHNDIAVGQQEDFRGILGIGLEKKISPSFSLTLYNQEYFYQNLSELGTAFLDGGINYRFNRNIAFGANYRFILQRDLNNNYHPRQMVAFDAAYSKGYGRFSATLRARLQNTYYPIVINDTKQNSVAYNRDRLTVRYRYNYYITPFIFGELWYPINHMTHSNIDRVRGAIGFYYTFNEHFKTEFYYSVSQELNQSNKKTNYAVAIASYFKI